MPVYANSDQLYQNLKVLFNRIQAQDPASNQSLLAARIVIRILCTQPAGEVWIDGRRPPVQISYQRSALRPDLDVELSADTLHQILLAELPLRKALGSGQMKVRGPLWKLPALEGILHRGQAMYSQVLREFGPDGYQTRE